MDSRKRTKSSIKQHKLKKRKCEDENPKESCSSKEKIELESETKLDEVEAKTFCNEKRQKRLKAKKMKIEAFLELTKHHSDSTVKSGQVKDGGKISKKLKAKLKKAEFRLGVVKGSAGNTELEAIESSSDQTDNKLTGDELAQLRAQLYARKKAIMQKPKLYLTLEDLQLPNDQFSQSEEGKGALTLRFMPLFVMDIQHLILYAIQGNLASYKPRWCKLLRPAKISHVVVLVIEGVSATEFRQHADCFTYIKATFKMEAEMMSPTEYGMTVYRDLLSVPLPFKKFRNSQIGELSGGDGEVRVQRNILAIDMSESDLHRSESVSVPTGEAFNRVHLLLNPQQMIQENFPTPIASDVKSKNYQYTADEYKMVSAESPMFAVDCEMCQSTKHESELTWVAIVNENLETVYSSLVKPHNRIKNYLTQYSGVTKKLLDPVTTRLRDVQRVIRGILPPDAILCGQSLEGDLHALQMHHPYVIDTSVIFNLTGLKGMKPGLKRLARLFLNKDIQNHGIKGHNPVEDASSTMELVKLKLQKGPAFGDVTQGGLKLSKIEYTDKEKWAHNIAIHKQYIREEDSQVDDSSKETKTESSENSSNCSSCGNELQSKNCDDDTTTDSVNNGPGEDKCETCSKTVITTSSSTEVSPEKKDLNISQSESVSDNTEERLRKKRFFFERPGTNMSQSFFTSIEGEKKTVQLIGDCPEFSEVPTDLPNLTHVTTDCDKTTAKKCKKSTQDSFLTMAIFNECKVCECDSEEDKKAQLAKLDKLVKKSLKNVPENSLVTVVLSGYSDKDRAHKTLCLNRLL